MPTISVEADLLRELLVRRDELVQVITAGLASQEWDRVMPAFDALLLAIKFLFWTGGLFVSMLSICPPPGRWPEG